jgi:probable phosphoglycerate mutase
MRTIWLIRHAESESNSGLPTNDPSSINITAKGKLEAQAVANYFSETPSLIVTSPYIRTKQTAVPVLKRFPNVPTEEWPIQEFTYLDSPRYVGTTNSQRSPMATAYWERCDPEYCDGPDSESFANLIARIRHFKGQIVDRNEKFVAVFTHGLFVRILLWTLFAPHMPINMEYMRQSRVFCNTFTFPNGGIFKMQVSDTNELYFGPLITSHLANLPLAHSS